MKVKELQKTVNVAWSPAQQYPIYLAAGTAAQQLDASNASSVLEIYSGNFGDPGYDLELKGSQKTSYRFQKVVWSPTGFGGTHPNGLIVGGCEGGHLEVYSASKLLAGEDALLARQDKHTGPIRGLDFNPFQHYLLASVASESEILIWDLNNTSTPMAPGTVTQPLEDIQNVAWNRQVQHILTSVFSSKCVIWDLRKNEQIIKLSDTQSRVRWRAVQWHPDIATQLWLASEEDQAPFVQLWDLRYATAPAKTIQIHQRGVLGMSWCPKDSDLMVSCGKDNKIICWNPNSEQAQGEILSEVATTIQWYSDVHWCPRNPALIASSSLDGNVSIYSLYGGSQQQVQTSNKIADSFPGMDQFAQAPIPQASSQVVYSDLKKTPKWMKKPAGVSFGFGGRLVLFNQKNQRNVAINQVVTEPELIQRSNSLEKALDEGNFAEYCKQKADEVGDQHRRYLWYFLKAYFEANPKDEMLNLLGYNKDDIVNKFQKFVKSDDLQSQSNVDQVASQMATLIHGGDNNALFDAIAAGNKVANDTLEKEAVPFRIPVGDDKDGLICQAILSGNIEAAVEICMDSGRDAEALIIASIASSDYLQRVQNRYLNKNENELSNIISALVSRDWINVMSRCTIDSWKEALVAALTHDGGQMANLCVRLGERLQSEATNPSTARNAILCYICAGNLEKIVEAWLELRGREKGQNVKLSTNEIQELVEMITLLKKGLELQGHDVEPAGKHADLLSEYASLLAAQGALQSALSYLGPSIDPHLVELRERLYYALGHKQQQSYSHGSISHQQQENMFVKPAPTAKRFGPQRSSNSFSAGQPVPPIQGAFNTSLPGAFPANPPQVQPWNIPPAAQAPVSAVPTFNAVSSFQQSQPVQSKPPMAPPTVNEGLSQPQRPSSVGSQGSTPLTRSKYLLDPSVSSGPNYGQTAGLYNPPMVPNMGSQGFNSPYNQFNTSPMSPASVPTSSYQPMQPSPGLPAANNFKPFVSAQNNIPGMSNPASYLSGIPPIETAQQAMPPPPPSHRNPTPPPGWNDPPAIKSTRSQVFYSEHNEMSAKHAGTRKWEKIIGAHSNANETSKANAKARQNSSEGTFMFQSKGDTSQVNPITHPLFLTNPSQGQNGFPDPNAAYNNPQFQTQPLQPPVSHQQQQQPQQMPFQTHAISAPPQDNSQFINQMNPPRSQLYNSYQESQIPPPKPEPPKQKPPLPEEFTYLQTVLEELKNQCISVAPDPRTKRKFVDVGKRLESLYDALRDGKLTPNTLTSLNQIVQSIQIGDYQNALVAHTLIASGPDFSQTASFMPGIKVLVQSAAELKVFLR